ncbi:MAG: hypothetical protein WCE80_02260 [Acidimicrobiia bacterium]
MKLIRKRGPRSSVALFSVAALALAMTGILYAHWTQTLTAATAINTGALGVVWSPAGTDDDGNVGNDTSGTDNGTNEAYDQWGDDSSRDPAEPGPGLVDRYDKDVGRCYANADAVSLTITAENAYPSYHCTVYTDVTNEGSIPVKAGAFDLSVGGAASGYEITGDGLIAVPTEAAPELTINITQGIYCGTQIDPAESVDVSSWFHVEQAAAESSTYTTTMTQEFVNWNEWDASFCTVGAIVADADGTPIGIANGTAIPGPLPTS